MPKNKDELVTQVENSKGLYVLGLATVLALSRPDVPNLLRKSHVDFGEQKTTFNRLAGQLEDPKDRQWILEELHKVFLRSYIRETYDLIWAYCKDTKQVSKMRDQPWFHFARLLRPGVF